MRALTEFEVQARMSTIEGWEYNDKAIHTSLEFNDFKDAFSVMTRIAFEAEKMNHHPDWSNVYKTLNITLSTHDAGGLTEKDFELAKIIDALVS
ncbi:MAG: 4a-hydroxytetrahydrobiopterin dehydratase [Sediminicola sp.]|jgi:4a-hydroxytetrahydrobiopterin dehydratase|tara:strand:+ start:1310 stop:1591 length:282 start_codon:yes stop_codon:yes gene_type:complete